VTGSCDAARNAPTTFRDQPVIPVAVFPPRVSANTTTARCCRHDSRSRFNCLTCHKVRRQQVETVGYECRDGAIPVGAGFWRWQRGGTAIQEWTVVFDRQEGQGRRCLVSAPHERLENRALIVSRCRRPLINSGTATSIRARTRNR
jgi:hypothetical protein